jgi:hypothetical protein
MVPLPSANARRLFILPVVAALAVIAAGCGGGSDSQVAQLEGASQTTSTAMTTTPASAASDPQEALLSFVKCMRGEGIDLPDPDFSGGGPGRGRGQGGGFLVNSGIDPRDPKFQAAQQKCRPLLASIEQRFSPELRQAFQDAALEFAKCMRERGFDVPDPDFSQAGPGPGGGLFRNGNLNPRDPKTRAAIDECRSAFDGLRDRFGGPGGAVRVPPPR